MAGFAIRERSFATLPCARIKRNQRGRALHALQIDVEVSEHGILGLGDAAIRSPSTLGAHQVGLPHVGRIAERLDRRLGGTRLMQVILNHRLVGQTGRQHVVLAEMPLTEADELVVRRARPRRNARRPAASGPGNTNTADSRP